MTLRIGMNIHNKARAGQERSAEEKNYLPGFLKQLNPSAIVVMDNFDLARDLHTLLPNTIVCYRQSNSAEGHLWKQITPEQYVTNQAGITKPGMPLYVMNEMDSKMPIADLTAAIKWMVRVMELLAVKGCIAVIDNEGPGQPTLDWFTDDAKWAAVKPLFECFKRYPQMYWGLHPYWETAQLEPLASSAIHRAIEPLLKRRDMDMPQIIFTEIGRDAAAGGKRNSWRSQGITEEQFAAEIIRARNTLWTEKYIRGACVFCYGSVTEQWASFDIESNKILHTALIGANQTEQPAPPAQPVPDPVPFELQALRMLRDNALSKADRWRKVSLELATISDDCMKDVALLEALIKIQETKLGIPPVKA